MIVTATLRNGSTAPVEVHTPDCWDHRRRWAGGAAGCICPPPPVLDALASARDILSRIRDENAAPERNVIDVTDRLTPGARAAAVERARVASMLTASADRADVARARGFADGRAYERGASAARMPGGKREAVALRRARAYLEGGDPRGAALVLAGYTGTAVR